MGDSKHIYAILLKNKIIAAKGRRKVVSGKRTS